MLGDSLKDILWDGRSAFTDSTLRIYATKYVQKQKLVVAKLSAKIYRNKEGDK